MSYLVLGLVVVSVEYWGNKKAYYLAVGLVGWSVEYLEN